MLKTVWSVLNTILQWSLYQENALINIRGRGQVSNQRHLILGAFLTLCQFFLRAARVWELWTATSFIEFFVKCSLWTLFQTACLETNRSNPSQKCRFSSFALFSTWLSLLRICNWVSATSFVEIYMNEKLKRKLMNIFSICSSSNQPITETLPEKFGHILQLCDCAFSKVCRRLCIIRCHNKRVRCRSLCTNRRHYKRLRCIITNVWDAFLQRLLWRSAGGRINRRSAWGRTTSAESNSHFFSMRQ